mmetsp:Transcript_32936/g.104539  ORF Transcript_32936/g.104539 Transcript_32936/m.104539 type:complete len:254 (+) Transcript_32936:223-984(+)
MGRYETNNCIKSWARITLARQSQKQKPDQIAITIRRRSPEVGSACQGEKLREVEGAIRRSSSPDAAEVEGSTEVLLVTGRLDPSVHCCLCYFSDALVQGEVLRRQAVRHWVRGDSCIEPVVAEWCLARGHARSMLCRNPRHERSVVARRRRVCTFPVLFCVARGRCDLVSHPHPADVVEREMLRSPRRRRRRKVPRLAAARGFRQRAPHRAVGRAAPFGLGAEGARVLQPLLRELGDAGALSLEIGPGDGGRS